MKYDLLIVGSGPAGLLAAIQAARKNKSVVILEKLAKPSLKLKSTGGGRCNLGNTLSDEKFIESFGKNGRFILKAIKEFNHQDLIEFCNSINLETSIKDGFRIFPSNHNSTTVLEAFFDELNKLNIQIKLSTTVLKLHTKENQITSIQTNNGDYEAKNILISTGGKGFSTLGGGDEAYSFIEDLGHTITPLYPAMIPLKTKENPFASCKADTIAKATVKIDIKKYSKTKLCADLIFTKDGLRGPVILDFARYVTPLLAKLKEVPIVINMTKLENEDQILHHIKNDFVVNPSKNILENIQTLLPICVAKKMLELCSIKEDEKFNKIDGVKKQKLLKILSWTPFSIVGTDGFEKAMVTQGGVSLKQIDPNTMRSKLFENLYFAGEVIDIDGPCGGFNLQWAFSSAHLAVKSL